MFIDLFAAELRRYSILTVRYPVESLMGILMTTLLFLGLFAGGTYLAGADFGRSAGALILGYFAWLVLVSGLGHVAGEVESDGKTGVLEAVFCAGYRPVIVFLARAAAALCLTVVTSAAVCIVAALATGQSIDIRAFIALPIATLGMTAVGLGMAAGGAALLVKKIGVLLAPLYLVLLPLMMVRFETWDAPARGLAMLLPAAPSAAMLRDSAARELAAGGWDIAAAVGSGLFYLAVGIAAFEWCSRTARRRGVIGMH